MPAINTRPVLGESSPASSASSVDLPAPDAPTMARVSPVRTLRLTSARMVSGPVGAGDRLRDILGFENDLILHQERP